MYCFKCGTELPSTAKYCPNCGKEQSDKKLEAERITFETKIEQESIKENEFKISNILWIKIAYYISIIVSFILILAALNSIRKGEVNLSLLILCLPLAAMFYYFNSTYSFFKRYPASLNKPYKILTLWKTITGYISILLAGLALIGSISFFVLYELNSLFIGINMMMTLYALAMIYYVLRTFSVLKKQVVIISDKEQTVTIKNISTDKIETISQERWELTKKMYGEDKYEIISDK